MYVFGVILVRIPQHQTEFGGIRSISRYCPNGGKYGPEYLRIQMLFTQWKCQNLSQLWKDKNLKHNDWEPQSVANTANTKQGYYMKRYVKSF